MSFRTRCAKCTIGFKGLNLINSQVSKHKGAFNDIHEGSVDHYNWTVKGLEY